MSLDLTQLYDAAQAQGAALPVHKWNPPFCGDIDLRIAGDGRWFYNGTPIQRPAMVQLFARILRREGDAYFLVTPAEKVGITVEDVPFIAVEMTREPDALTFRTHVGDRVTAGADHPMRFVADDNEFRPYIMVRDGLEARLSRDLAQGVAGLGEIVEHKGAPWFGLKSAGIFFPITPADSLP